MSHFKIYLFTNWFFFLKWKNYLVSGVLKGQCESRKGSFLMFIYDVFPVYLKMLKTLKCCIFLKLYILWAK